MASRCTARSAHSRQVSCCFGTDPERVAGIPHSTMQDDIYNGMFIPKGTMVFANALYVLPITYIHAHSWLFAEHPTRSMAMDKRVYHDPELFQPERFLPGPHGGPEPFPHASFGFGRR